MTATAAPPRIDPVNYEIFAHRLWAIGEEGRLEYAVIGDPVNRAAKLQNHTKAEGVRALASRFARDRAVQQGYAPSRMQELRPAREVNGVSAPVDIVVLA